MASSSSTLPSTMAGTSPDDISPFESFAIPDHYDENLGTRLPLFYPEAVFLPPAPLFNEHSVRARDASSVPSPRAANTKRKASARTHQARKRRSNAEPAMDPNQSPSSTSSSSSSISSPSSGGRPPMAETYSQPIIHSPQLLRAVEKELNILWEACSELYADDAEVVYDEFGTKMRLRVFLELMLMKKEELKLTNALGI